MNAPTRAVIYLRISQDRTGAGLGVDRQREDCEALAARNGWNVVETYTDNDVSAFSGKTRKDYRRMLADLDAGIATIVIAWHTDRWRSTSPCRTSAASPPTPARPGSSTCPRHPAA
jgi:site-specific DNA recombinase